MEMYKLKAKQSRWRVVAHETSYPSLGAWFVHLPLINDGLVTCTKRPTNLCKMFHVNIKFKFNLTNMLADGSINLKGMSSSRIRQLIALQVLS